MCVVTRVSRLRVDGVGPRVCLKKTTRERVERKVFKCFKQVKCIGEERRTKRVNQSDVEDTRDRGRPCSMGLDDA